MATHFRIVLADKGFILKINSPLLRAPFLNISEGHRFIATSHGVLLSLYCNPPPKDIPMLSINQPGITPPTLATFQHYTWEEDFTWVTVAMLGFCAPRVQRVRTEQAPIEYTIVRVPNDVPYAVTHRGNALRFFEQELYVQERDLHLGCPRCGASLENLETHRCLG